MYPRREHASDNIIREVFASWSLASFFFRYTFVILVTVATILLKWQFRSLYEGSPYLLLVVPVVLSVFIGGFIPGIIATLLSIILVNYYFMGTQLGFRIDTTHVVQTISFLAEGILASALVQYVVRSRDQEYRLRQWYEVTLSSIGDAVIATDNEGYVMYMNGVAQQLTGWKIAKAYGKHLTKVFNTIDEQTGKLADNPVEAVLKKDQTIGMTNHTVLISKKGEEIPIDDSAAPIKDMDGTTIGVILVFHDVTEARKNQEALRLSEERLRLALRHTKIMAWGQDRRLRYTWVQNISFKNYKAEDVLGKTDRQIKAASRENVSRMEELKREVMKTKTTKTIELNLGTTDKPLYYEVIIQPVTDWRGSVSGISCIAIDVTRRKLVEEKKEEFMSIASHELRTPLTSIKGYAQILERIIIDSGNRKAQVYVARIQTYVNRLNGLISDLLDVSKIQAGKLQLNMEKINLDDLVGQSIEGAQMIDTTHKIIKRNAAHLTITGDRNRLEQVFSNLLSNAIKYSPDADKVIVNIERKDGEAVITVKDFGIGIRASSMLHLFSRFYRVEETANRFSGLGIGLYISNEIVKRHGGKIAVESKEGEGSTFSVMLPL